MITFLDTEGVAIATFRFAQGRLAEDRTDLPTTMAHRIMDTLRSVPREILSIDVKYHEHKDMVFMPFNQPRYNDMDIEREIAGKFSDNVGKEEKPRKMIFVAPSAEILPDDGIFNFVTVESVYDMQNVPDRSVAMFSPAAFGVFKIVVDNQAAFGVDLIVLSGLPSADYSAAFDALVWSIERSSYASLLSELSIARETQAQLRASKATAHDVEKQSYTRKTGEVKEMTKFNVHQLSDPAPIESDDIGADDDSPMVL